MKIKILVISIALALLCIGAFGQTARLKVADKFEIVSSEDMFVTSQEECVRNIFLTVLVRPRYATHKNLDQYSKTIGNRYPNKSTITVVFLINRKLAKRLFDNDVEDAVGRSIRGIYQKATGLRYYPTGITEKDVEEGISEKK